MTDVAAPAEEDLAAEIEARVRAAGTSFYWGMRVLPADRRAAMYAIYAFCREVDDIADDAPADQKGPGLAEWRREIDRLYAGEPRHPVARALLAPMRAYKLERRDFLAIIDGMEMDAQRDIRAPSLQELDLYCARVAGAVGRLSVRAFGDGSARALDVAEALGRALQLTNILRDLVEDAQRNRLYLPREKHPNLPRVCEDIAQMARQKFAEAERAMADCSRRAMRPAALMKAMYRAVLDALERRGWTALDQPVKTSKWLKLWLVLRHGLM